MTMGKTALLFPGQGAQKVGMTRRLCEESEGARRLFVQAGEILGFDLLALCQEGPQERLDATDVSQPALYVTGMAGLEWAREHRSDLLDDCCATAGLSLGEYTALAFAGAFSFAEGLRLVRTRGEAMQAAANVQPSGMVSALLLDLDQVREVREQASAAGLIEIANFLCPGNTVLSGEEAACHRAVELIGEAGGRPVPLAVAGAFHTALMEPARQQLAVALEEVNLQSPRIPVFSNVDVATHEDPEEIRDLLLRQVCQPVRWEESIRALMDLGAERFLELPPAGVLKGLMKRINRKTKCEALLA